MIADLDLNNNRIINVDEGVNNQDAVNKHQLDVGLQTKPNTNTVILRDCTNNMNSDLDMNNNRIINVENPLTQKNYAMGYKFFGDNFFVSMYGDINCMTRKIFNIGPNTNRDQVVDGGYVIFFKKKQDINMNIKKIINLKNPENSTDAVNKRYIDNKLSIIHESNKNIDFKEQYNVINSKQQSFTDLPSHYDNLVSYNDVKNIFFKQKRKLSYANNSEYE